jgi:hypothetical protein
MPVLRFNQPYNTNTRMPFSDAARTNLRTISHVMQAEALILQTTFDDTYQTRFFDYATGADLDHWGIVLELPRIMSPLEADAAYRIRLKTKFQTRGDAKTLYDIDTALDTYGATVTPTTACDEIAEWYQFVDNYPVDHDVYQWDYNPKDTSELGYLTYSCLMNRIPTMVEAAAEATILRNLQVAGLYGAIGRLRPPTIDATTPATTAVSVPLGDFGWRLDKTVDNLVLDDCGLWITGVNTNVRCTYDFGAGVLKRMVRFRIMNIETAGVPTADFKHIRIDASNDGVTFTKIPIVRYLDNCTAYNTDEATLAQATTLGMWCDMLLDPGEYHYRYWSIWVYDNWGNANIGTGEVEWMEDSQFDPMYIKQYAHSYGKTGSSQFMWDDNFYRATYPAVVTDYYDLLVGGAVWSVVAYTPPNGALQGTSGAAATTYILANKLVAPNVSGRAVTTLDDVLIDSQLEINDVGDGWIGYCLRYDATSGKFYAVGFDTNGASRYFVYYYDGAAYNLLTTGAVGVDMNAAGGQRVQIWLERNRLTLKVGAAGVILNAYECAGLHIIRGRNGFIKYDKFVSGKFDSYKQW